MSDDVLNATVIDRQDLTDDLAIVRVSPDSGQVGPFEPGQFCVLGLPRRDPPNPAVPVVEGQKPRTRLTRRAYSIASSARSRDHYELYLVLVPQGKLTPQLWNMSRGDRVWLDPQAAGHFTLGPIKAEKNLVMISTGTGVAPFMSMLRTYRHDQPRRWRRAVLINGVRCQADLGYRTELEAIAREDPSVFYLPSVSREPEGSGWRGLRGRVQTALDPQTYQRLVGVPLDPRDTEVLLCGNPNMIEEVQQLLEGREFVTDKPGTPGNIHFERYW